MSEASSKATEQFDVDKKNGVLAYVPSDTGFDLQPLSGIVSNVYLYGIDKGIESMSRSERKEVVNVEENKVTREVAFNYIYQLVAP